MDEPGKSETKTGAATGKPVTDRLDYIPENFGNDLDFNHSLLNNVPAVLYRCLCFPSMKVVFVSDEIERLTGYSRQDLSNKEGVFLGLVHTDDQDRFMDAARDAAAHQRQFSLEYRVVGKGGNTRWVFNSARYIHGKEKNGGWFDGFMLDITGRMQDIEEIRKAKITAEEANQAKSEFLANISHEIRTPLNSVLGFAELLEGMTTDPTQVKYLNSIKASGKNLMMLINDLLDLSKIEAGRMTLHYTFFDIHRLTDEVKNVFSLRVAIKGIGYTEEISPNFPLSIRFDETRLRQILINLVGNAVKFTHQGEVKIIILAKLNQGDGGNRMALEIKVVDTGIGIPEDSYRVIFESFRQHSQLDSRKYGGTGLGLAITKRLVEAMDGAISVESQVGKGSTFTVSFPAVEYAETQDDKTAAEFLMHGLVAKNTVNQRDSRHNDVPAGQTDQSGLTSADVYQLLNRFNKDLSERWKSYESKQPLKEIKQFAQEIIDMGKKYKLSLVYEYGDQLLSTIENFDIEEMRLKLDYFPDLLKQLNKLSHES